MAESLVLAIKAENADAILDGDRTYEYRSVRPKRLPARAYLAVVGAHAVVGECRLGEADRKTAKGWALPVSAPPLPHAASPERLRPHQGAAFVPLRRGRQLAFSSRAARRRSRA